MTTTINRLTVEEFQKHFNRMPVSYRDSRGEKYVTFVTTLSIFKQAVSAEDNKNLPLDKVIGCVDRVGNICKIAIRNFNDPEGEFKMIAIMFNTTTGERIALLAA